MMADKQVVVNDVLCYLNLHKDKQANIVSESQTIYTNKEVVDAYKCLTNVLNPSNVTQDFSYQTTSIPNLISHMLNLLRGTHNVDFCTNNPRFRPSQTCKRCLQNCQMNCCYDQLQNDMKKILSIMNKNQEEFQKVRAELILHVSFLNNVCNIDSNVYVKAAKLTYAQADQFANQDKMSSREDLSSTSNSTSSESPNVNMSSDLSEISESSQSFLSIGHFMDTEDKTGINKMIKRCDNISSSLSNVCSILNPMMPGSLQNFHSDVLSGGGSEMKNFVSQGRSGGGKDTSDDGSSKGNSPLSHLGDRVCEAPLKYRITSPPSQVLPYHNHGDVQSLVLPGKHAKNFRCGICSACFTTKFSLDRHQRLHSGEKPFTCMKCGRQFRQKSHLIKHQRTVCYKRITQPQNIMSLVS